MPVTAAAAEAPDSPESDTAGRAAVLFNDISASAGIDFRHENGATEQKFMAETIGAERVLALTATWLTAASFEDA